MSLKQINLRVTGEELDALDDMAGELEASRNTVIRVAVSKLLALFRVDSEAVAAWLGGYKAGTPTEER